MKSEWQLLQDYLTERGVIVRYGGMLADEEYKFTFPNGMVLLFPISLWMNAKTNQHITGRIHEILQRYEDRWIVR